MTLEHAPAGFSPVNTVLSFDVMTQDRTEVEPLLNFEPLEETLAVVRGDIMFRKVDEGGMTLAGIPFLLSYANGEGPDLTESHVVVTNEPRGLHVQRRAAPLTLSIRTGATPPSSRTSMASTNSTRRSSRAHAAPGFRWMRPGYDLPCR